MSIERDKMIKLLESKIETIVRNVISEKYGESDVKTSNATQSKRQHMSNNRTERHNDIRQKKVNNKRGDDSVEKSQAYKRQYKAIEKELNKPEIDATSIFTKAGIIPNNKDDAARSHAFKKLHKDKTPDGTGNYKFDQNEVAKIFNALP
jgi:hypothetical protein